MNVNIAARVACIIVIINSVAACNSDSGTVTEFPGLAIKATCPTGRTSPRYAEVEGTYPGERASADPIEARFLADIGELPLPCIDPRAGVYRIYQFNESGSVVVGTSQSSTGARVWVVSQPRQGKIRRAERPLLTTEWNRIASQITAISFWKQPARLIQPNREQWRGGWTVEGYNGERYHRVSRFYLDDSLNPVVGAFLDLARPLLEGAK